MSGWTFSPRLTIARRGIVGRRAPIFALGLPGV